jgi:hypothetical protein
LNNSNKKIKQLFSSDPIKSNFCQLHHINISDAEMVYDLRVNRKDSFLKKTTGNIDDQKKYLEGYFERFIKMEEIYYKILDTKTNKFSGVLRLTEINSDKAFNWQSFVVSEESSPNVAIDAMIMIYRIGFDFLDRDFCGPWEVDKNFTKMVKIHNFIKMAKIVGEQDKYYLFSVKKIDYQNNINKFLKMGYGVLGGLE